MNINYEDKSGLYSYSHNTDNIPTLAEFKLHNHNNMNEILIFLEGNSEFYAEGSVYRLNQFDTVVARCDEMHRVYHLDPNTRYERIVINIHNSFFTRYDCEEFKNLFISRPLGVNNLILGNQIQQNNILEIAKSIDHILTTDPSVPEIVLRSKLIDILYNLNKLSSVTRSFGTHNEQLRSILMYINENISSPLTLDAIADKFYITKYYLCHLFKKQTGLSVNKYITHKRILLTKELYAQGKTLLQASSEAGFSNYSNFYKMYKNEKGKSPKEDLK